jgi:hypothetical protein
MSLSAQTFRGGIQGTVADATGHPVGDALVTVNNEETGLTRTAKTSSAGTYFISELPIGSYDIKVEKAGSRQQTLKGIKVEVSSNQRVDVQLKPGVETVEAEKTTQVVEMTGQSPLINAAQDNLGGRIGLKEISELPINGRDILKTFLMVSGAASDAGLENDSAGSFGYFSMNGNRGRSNNFLIDGTDMNDSYRNLSTINEPGVFGVPATILPLDSLQEISIINSTEAEFGRSSGATVDFVTKSGTNGLHGSAYEYFRNNALDARNFFNSVGSPQDVFHNNQFGGSLGGPIVKDRTFWFVAYEGQRESVGFPVLARVPTAAEINQSIANNGGVVNPVTANLLAHGLWPAANRPADSQGNNLVTSTQAPNRADSVIAKIDQRFGEKDFLTGRYFYGNSDQSAPLALVGGGILPGFNTVVPTTVNVASVSYTHIFGLHLLTEVRGGYNRLAKTTNPQDHTFDPNSIGLNLGTSAQDFGLPAINVANFATLGSALSDPRGRVDTNTQFFNNYTYTQGRHNWKFGYEYRRTVVDGFLDAGYRGKLGFKTLDAFIAGTPTSGRQAQGNSARTTFQNNHSFYLQDNFSLFSNLTLNYGVRWEYFGVIGEDKNQFSILDPSGNLQLVKQLYPRDLNNFAPRAGLAWDIKGDTKTVVRAGWGMYYDAASQDFFVGQLPFNTFNSGPGYNGIGPNPITFSFAPGAVLQPGVRVFAPGTFGATDVFTVDQHLRTPYIQMYNVNIERELTKNIALQVGYVGSAGRKLFRYIDLNQANPTTGTFAFPAFGVVNQLQTSASSNYNALQATLRFRNWHGLSSILNYSWSHSIDNASDGLDFVPNASQPDNSFRPDLEKASSNFDQRQHLSWTYSYQIPKFPGWHALTSGWSTNGVLTVSAGQPFNLNYLFEGNFNGSFEFFGRPDLVGNPFAGTHGPGQFLNLSAFQVPCTLNGSGNCVPGTKHFGNLGRNAFVGPSVQDLALSLAKSNNITERVKMQIRLDVFNPFNHPNFANPLWPNFFADFLQNGRDAAGRGVGFLPLTVTPDVGIGNPFMGGGGPRDIQLALRFTF